MHPKSMKVPILSALVSRKFVHFGTFEKWKEEKFYFTIMGSAIFDNYRNLSKKFNMKSINL